MTRGLILGTFMPYHAGHAHLIRTARARVDVLTVLVCSLTHEPIPGALRHAWVAQAHPDCRVIHVDEDVLATPEEHPRFWSIWRDLVPRHAGPVDVVFTSETYGGEIARHLDARHICVDLHRATVPISGTAIRASPLVHWAFLSPQVRRFFVRRVAIVGTESTGKSTLAADLAGRFQTVWVPEYGRAYCAERDSRALTLEDIEQIGRGQLEAEEAEAGRANRFLFCDTDLATTCTWSDMIVGARPAWLTQAARSRQYDRVLLLADDVPWVPDGTRILADRRREHTERLRCELDAAHQRYDELRGSFAGRWARATAIVETMVQEPLSCFVLRRQQANEDYT